MKLIYCPECHDIVRLKQEKKTCDCGAIWGYYKDDINAVISPKAIPLGIANSWFYNALENRPKYGQSGTLFDAWVIPKECETVEIEKDK